ncbi:MAG: helix-turn-helix transcriptional regulator [Pseudobutyrivibrio sp.]|nr:helix-turn-helix transcriptional regulator [Pseudobutyrivibrio sp.]
MRKETDTSTIGARIKNYRLKRGYTQEQLAEILGVAKSTVSYYENNKVDMKRSVLEEVAAALDVSVSALLEDEHSIPVDEMELLLMYRRLKKDKSKEAVLKSVRMIIELEE